RGTTGSKKVRKILDTTVAADVAAIFWTTGQDSRHRYPGKKQVVRGARHYRADRRSSGRAVPAKPDRRVWCSGYRTRRWQPSNGAHREDFQLPVSEASKEWRLSGRGFTHGLLGRVRWRSLKAGDLYQPVEGIHLQYECCCYLW